MVFNSFLWGNYKESKRGQELISYFKNYEDNIFNKRIGIYTEINSDIEFSPRSHWHDLDEYIKAIKELSLDIGAWEKEGYICGSNTSSKIASIDDAENLYITVLDEQGRVFEPFGGEDIQLLSDCFYITYPDYFFPYYFNGYYYRLVAIFNEFGIYLPPVPPRNDLHKRMFHYFELCRSLHEFRMANNLSGAELSAFLYGFALNMVKKPEIGGPLPEPRKAYFVGGGTNNNGDSDYLDNADSASVSFWNGNPETNAGDIIVMYCLTPRSHIHSIWRAIAPGCFEPFFYFYKGIYIGHPMTVKPISLSELKNDEVLSEMPLVRGNMQGINGRLILKKYYDRILHLLEARGENISPLPRLPDDLIQEVELKNEKDVERHLLEPLLKKLGFAEHQWERQLRIRVARGERVIPDYVILPKGERDNRSGHWVWEAKYSIVSGRQLKDDFGQVKTYALLLGCKGLGLISREGVWISVPDFSFGKIKFWSWKQVNENDHLDEIFDIAGNKNGTK